MKDDGREWLTVREAAKRMNMPEEQVREAAKRGELRATFAYGDVLIEPAVLSYHGPPMA